MFFSVSISPHKGLQNYTPRGLSLWGRLISNSHLFSVDSVFPFPDTQSQSPCLLRSFSSCVCSASMPQEYRFPSSTSVFILNLFLWFPGCLDLHGCSSIFGKAPLPQMTVLLRALPSLVPCPCGSALQSFLFPVPAVSLPQRFPYADSCLNSCWPSPGPSSILLLPPLPLSFNHLCPFFIPGVIISSIYPAILPSRFQALLSGCTSTGASSLPESQSHHPFPKSLFACSVFPAVHPYFFAAPPSNPASPGAIFIHC